MSEANVLLDVVLLGNRSKIVSYFLAGREEFRPVRVVGKGVLKTMRWDIWGPDVVSMNEKLRPGKYPVKNDLPQVTPGYLSPISCLLKGHTWIVIPILIPYSSNLIILIVNR